MPIWPLSLLVNSKTAGIAAGAAVLVTLGSFGLGYWKGVRAQASVSNPPQLIESKTARTSELDKKEQSSGTSDSKSDVDEVETVWTLPSQTLPDGTIETKTRRQRQSVKHVATAATADTKAQAAEVIVEKRVEIPCPNPAASVNPLTGLVSYTAPAAALPRWMAGPSVARDFSLDKTIFGGSLAVRAGPVWFRVLADSHPQVGVSAEVFWGGGQ